MRKDARTIERAAASACVQAARYGHTAVIRAARLIRKKPIATGTYQSGWQVQRLPKNGGAVLGNVAKHATFVERGRRPGKMPPKTAIIRWLRVKKFTPKEGQDPLKKPRKSSPRTVAGWKRAQRRRRAYGARLHSLAHVIAKAIGRRGIAARPILKRMLRPIRRRLDKEMNDEIKRMLAKAKRPKKAKPPKTTAKKVPMTALQRKKASTKRRLLRSHARRQKAAGK